MTHTIKDGEKLNGLVSNVTIEMKGDVAYLVIKLPFYELESTIKYGRDVTKEPMLFNNWRWLK